MRGMAEAQRTENGANQEQVQDALNPAMNPTVELIGPKEEPSRSLSDNKAPSPLIGMYQTLATLRVGDLIRERLPIETTEGRTLLNCPPSIK